MLRTAFSLLLLATATPVLAAQPEDAGEPQARSRSDRPARVERPAPRPQRMERIERAQPRFERNEPRIERVERVERIERVQAPRPGDVPRQLNQRQEQRRERWTAPAPAESSEAPRAGDSVTNWRWRERSVERRRRAGDVPPAPPSPVLGETLPGPKVVTPPVTSRQQGSGVTRGQVADALRDRISSDSWRREWRQDRRYDWRRHRDRDRSRFRLGFYVDPFGWGYRPWQLGWSLPSRYYADRYWLNDPWYYSLPPVYGPYRWIRYWNDALLVDLRTGRVVDVIPRFFW